jgi:cardiolipin synthase
MEQKPPASLAIIIAGRDASLLGSAAYYRATSLAPPVTFTRFWNLSIPSAEVHPTQLSKYNTFLQLWYFGGVLAHLFFAAGAGEAAFGSFLAADTLAAIEKAAEWGIAGLTPIVAGTTLWSGYEYALRRDTVKFLGSDRDYNARHYRRGRLIHGTAFSAFVAWAAWWWYGSWKESGEHLDEK